MVLVLVWREDVFAVESGTTQVSLQADWLQEGDYQYSVEEDETVTLRNYIGTESVIVTPKEVGGKEVTRIGDSCFLRKTDRICCWSQTAAVGSGTRSTGRSARQVHLPCPSSEAAGGPPVPKARLGGVHRLTRKKKRAAYPYGYAALLCAKAHRGRPFPPGARFLWDFLRCTELSGCSGRQFSRSSCRDSTRASAS